MKLICAVASIAGILLGIGYMLCTSGVLLVGIPCILLGLGLTVVSAVVAENTDNL